MDVYESCPVYEGKNFLMRYVDASDAPDLFLVYSDEKALPYFNSDNCDGDFHCTLPEYVQSMIAAWCREYERRGFVRWSVIDKRIGRAVGTVELFNRKAEDYFDDCGLLRLDLRSDYEQEDIILEVLSLIIPHTPVLFGCGMIATKVPPFAEERKAAVGRLGFTASGEKLIGGHDGRAYTDYYVLARTAGG